MLVAAQSKVDAALPPELRARTARLRERFLVDVPGWFQAPEPVPALAALAAALWDGRRIDIRYQRGDRLVRRRLDPLGLVLKGSIWYLVARARRPDGIRTFRVSRVVGVTRVRRAGAAPAGLRPGDDVGRRRRGRSTATCAATSSTPWSTATGCGCCATPCPSRRGGRPIDSAGPPGPDGRCAVTIHSESLEVAHDELLRVGRALEVIDPLDLRDAIAATGRALAATTGSSECPAISRPPHSDDRKHSDGGRAGVAYRGRS